MKLEGLAGRTLHALPSGLSPAMALAVRAGLLRPGRGGWIVLPLGMRVLSRISEAVLRGLGLEPVAVLTPEQDGLEKAIADLLRGETQSYRHLPLRIAVAAPPWESGGERNLDVGGSGQIDVVGAFASQDSLAEFMGRLEANLVAVASSAAVDVARAKGLGNTAAVVAFGNGDRHAVLSCEGCRETHLREIAPFARDRLEEGTSAPKERLHTPGASTIQTLAEMLGVSRRQTLKAVFLAVDGGGLVFAVLRGDLEVSIEKLAGVTGTRRLRPATDAEIIAGGAIPGYASPIGLQVRRGGEPEGVRVVADPSVFTGSDFVAGANVEDSHFVHVDPRRDFEVSEVADIALPPADARCAVCGAPLAGRRGCIIARSAPLPAPVFSDETGIERQASAAWMRVDLVGLFEQLVSGCADGSGIAWPAPLAPADVHVLSLKEDEASRSLVHALENGGLTVLHDDRPMGAGAKFTDADLIGCPLRVTVSPRSLKAGGAELAGRQGMLPEVVPLLELPGRARIRLAALMSS